ncbi:hypothetical protein BCR39DRAFT_550169 [Naematelia encephala]|uniref:Zinc finger C2H2 LYAR-type domain-containing protein n=1 Tax=Naematelia encephala TaxID=71784 RepID=A0A1Y2AKI3_9TREE|nr:hypothetical protein BCR39DRAFT_550169 [Naematelia encephala]
MVSFQCDGCADTVKKPKLDQHRQRCWASFTCLDCSTTFQGQTYKSHTSCVTEAEKYQGALYKAPKKGQTKPQPPAAPSVAEPVSTAPSPSAAPSTSTIHPSRLGQVGSAPSSSFTPTFPSRGGYAARGRGGGGGFRGGRAAFGGTAENTFAPRDGMRSWGSPAASAISTPVEEKQVEAVINGASQPVVISSTTITNGVQDKKKAKKRRGDKGGTGAKANSKSLETQTSEDTPPSEEHTQKKRKRDTSEPPVESTTTPSEKTLKRLKKNLAKLEKSPAVPLDEWLQRLGKGKKEDKAVDLAEILKSVKVVASDGKFELSL